MVITEDLDSDSHQSPIAFPVTFAFDLHPLPYIRSQNTSMNTSSMITSVPITGPMPHPNGWERLLSLFQLVCDISLLLWQRRVRVHKGGAEL